MDAAGGYGKMLDERHRWLLCHQGNCDSGQCAAVAYFKSADHPVDSVELQPDFAWTCHDCGAENYFRAIFTEMTPYEWAK
jgi:hypothetical protein